MKIISKIKIISVVLFAILIFGCQSKKVDDKSNMVSIDLDNIKEESIDDWFEFIELIPLASTDETLMKEASKMIKFDNNYYILDNWQHIVFAFDSLGNFVNSTKQLKGNGPNEYVSLVDFDIDRVNGNLHILDVVSQKIRIYDNQMSFVNNYNVDKKLLPLQYFKYLKDDFYVFYCPTRKKGEYVLKLYGAGREKVLKKEIPTIIEEADYLPNTLYSPFYEFNECLFFTQKYPNNELLKIDVENLSVEKYLQYDFKEHTFNLKDIKYLKSKNLDDYVNYVEDNNKNKAFIFNKCENNKYYIISVYYKHLIFIIRYDKATEQYKAIVNDYTRNGSLGRPILLDNDYYYSVINPQDVNIVINDALLSEQSRLVLSNLKEEDNPVIVKYRFKKNN